LEALLNNLMAWFAANPTASFEAAPILSDNSTGTAMKLKDGKRAA